VYSAPGVGTSFTILMRSQEARAPLPRAAGAGARPPIGLTVLAVGGEGDLVAPADRILGDAGCLVLVAADGPSALRTAAAHDGPIDVLVTDVVMPPTSGGDLAARLSATYPDLRVVFTSGYAPSLLVAQGHLASDACVVEKPLTARALLAAIGSAGPRVVSFAGVPTDPG
jgi:CheY-like chemotaxis protein